MIWLERLLLGLRLVVDLAALVHVHLRAAQRLLVERLADGPAHDRRAGREDLRRPFTITVKCDISASAAGQPATAPEHGRGHRHPAQQLHRLPPQIARGQAHVPRRLVGLGAVADALDQLDAGDAVLHGEGVDEVVGPLVHVVGAAPRDREVVAADGDRPAVDLGQAHHVGTGGEGPQVAVLVVLGRAHQRAGLDEAARVDDLVEPLPDRVAASRCWRSMRSGPPISRARPRMYSMSAMACSQPMPGFQLSGSDRSASNALLWFPWRGGIPRT